MTPPLIPLGYGKFARADRIFALIPLEGGERGDGRRTRVHVDGIEIAVVASRSEAAILHDIAVALGHEGPPDEDRRRRPPIQPRLF